MKPALLLVDLQNDFLAAPELQPNRDSLVNRAAALLDACRNRRLPVVHIWTTIRRDKDQRLPHWRRANRWMCVAGTPGHQTPDALRPLEREVIIHKTGFNAFANGQLAKALRKLKCDSVIISGLHLHACVRTAATECLERGWPVRVAEDATASNDPVHAAASRRWLADRCVSFEPVNGIVGWLDGRAPTLIHRAPRCSKDVLFEIAVAGTTEIAAATAAAHRAWVSWRETSQSVRQKMLENVASRLEASAASLARQMAIEIGKPVSHGREEVRRAADNIRDSIRRWQICECEICQYEM